MPSTQREQLSEINAKVTETAERVKMLNDWHNEVNEWRKQVDLSLATIKTNLEWIKWLVITVLGAALVQLGKDLLPRLGQ